MAFVPRNFEQILIDMIAHVRANTTVTDFSVGSVIRTILEACALEDDEQYFQMVQLLDAFRVATARGTDLDERAADYNLTRLQPKQAVGTVRVQDGGLTRDDLSWDHTSGTTSLQLDDSSDFPTAPFTVRLGEGTPQVEDVAVSNNNTITNVLTVVATVNAHSGGDRVGLTGGGDKTVNSGQQVQVAAQGGDPAIQFTTLDTATVLDGNYESGLVSIKATVSGKFGNVGATRISQFQGSPPFVGATVSNPSNTQGGRDIESDEDLRARILRRIDELSKGTPNALESSVVGVTDLLTAQRVVTSKLREDFSDPFNHRLFIDDGTGFVPSKTALARSTLFAPAVGGVDSTLTLNDASDFPTGGQLLVGAGTANAETVSYSSKTGNVLNLDALIVNSHSGPPTAAEVQIVDLVETAEEGQNFFQAADFPIVNNSFELFDDRTGVFVEQVEGTDYLINRSNGEIQYLGAGLPAGTIVLAAYTFYTGLLQEAQKVVTGDPDDRINYPGVVAGGIIVNLDTPTIRQIAVLATIAAKEGFTETDLRGEVQREIEVYIDARRIGENVIRAKMIDAAFNVPGVKDINIDSPTSNVVILEDELPVSSDSSGNTLVTVL
jgi:uncharacterized phage protein gp47/JayE